MQNVEIKDKSPHCSKHVLSDDFSFILRDTECNSKVFGSCEICGKDAVQVFHQKRYKTILHPITNQKNNQFITDCYGHYECLIKIRTQQLTEAERNLDSVQQNYLLDSFGLSYLS